MLRTTLAELLPVHRIKVPLRAKDKAGLIEELADSLAKACGVGESAKEDMRMAVLAREAVLSTGIGGGVALPHGRSEAIGELAVFGGRTDGPVDFEAVDGRPVEIIVLVVGPESASDEHIGALSRIGRLFRSDSLKQELIAAESAEDFHDAIRRAETS
ncbi:MAG: PTS sugar transporter subunit IIA [Gemmatimonadetes bacterium]|nr:PTS sugar transporter subunit IIA [Gemmatimonadota bacterium]